jgi:hypothetical protein
MRTLPPPSPSPSCVPLLMPRAMHTQRMEKRLLNILQLMQVEQELKEILSDLPEHEVLSNVQMMEQEHGFGDCLGDAIGSLMGK